MKHIDDPSFRNLVVELRLSSPLMYRDALPTLDGIVLSTMLDPKSEYVDPKTALNGIMGVIEHEDLWVPQASRLFSPVDPEFSSTTIIGSFLKSMQREQFQDAIMEREGNKKFSSIINRCGTSGTISDRKFVGGIRGQLNNSISTYQTVATDSVVALVRGNPTRLKLILESVVSIGCKRNVGYGMVEDVYFSEVEFKDNSWFGLMGNLDILLRPIPRDIYDRMSWASPVDSVCVGYKSFPPYSPRFANQQVPSWVPQYVNIDLGDVL